MSRPQDNTRSPGDGGEEGIKPPAEMRAAADRKAATVIRIVLFSLLSMWLLYMAVVGAEPNLEAGDGGEYILMTDALCRHWTPDLRPGDTFSPEAEERLKKGPRGPEECIDCVAGRDFLLGFVGTSDGRWYCWHFFFYPVLNLPMRGVVELFDWGALRAFTLTNAWLMIGAVAYMLFYTRYPVGLQVVGSLLFVWSSVLWYFTWLHPEVMTCAFVFVSVVAWFHQRRYQAILLSSLAAMQNPPLFLLSLFYLVPTVLTPTRGILRNLILCFATSVWVVVPPIFYWYHYGVGSVIMDFGFLDNSLISLRRLWGFFFDLNQGMILSMPTALPLFLFTYAAAVVTRLRGRLRHDGGMKTYDLLLPIVVIAMTWFIMPMRNWNHGMAGISRYATWCSMIPMAVLIQLMSDGWSRRRFVAAMLIIVTPQILAVQLCGGMEVDGIAYRRHTRLAELTLTYLPRMYNPDPAIFVARTLERKIATESLAAGSGVANDGLPDVVPFLLRDGRITKIAVRQRGEAGLLDFGWSEEEVRRVAEQAHFVNGWAYVHPGDFQSPPGGQ